MVVMVVMVVMMMMAVESSTDRYEMVEWKGSLREEVGKIKSLFLFISFVPNSNHIHFKWLSQMPPNVWLCPPIDPPVCNMMAICSCV